MAWVWVATLECGHTTDGVVPRVEYPSTPLELGDVVVCEKCKGAGRRVMRTIGRGR